MRDTDSTAFPFDSIGYWSEIKLEIIEKYAKAYSTILSNQPGLSHVYIDGFAGAGEHVNKKQEVVAGSPTRAIQVTPPFKEFFFIDLDGDKVDYLWRDPTRVSSVQAARLTAYWGDESWKTDAYRPARQTNLFDANAREKVDNDTVAEAFQLRLREVAGFKNVPPPLPMRNSKGAVVYYLFFASQKAVANDIVQQIFDKNRERRR